MIRPLEMALVIGCVVAGITVGQDARAQELGIGVARVGSDHDLLGTSTALEASIGTRLTSGLDVRLGLQHGRANFSSFGSTCVGLVSPDQDCDSELRSEESTTTTVFVSLPLTLASFGWGAVSLVPGVRRLAMDSRQEGTSSGRARAADKAAYGFELGAELAYRVWSRPAVSLHVGAHLATHPWFEEEIIADGYTPFERSVRLPWVEVGMHVRPGVRR